MHQTLIPAGQLRIAMTHEGPASSSTAPAGAVLYVHGATFPSTLAMFWRFGSLSWSDTLTRAGFHVFGMDLPGFGGSDRYPEMAGAADGAHCPGRAVDVVEAIAAAVDHVRAITGVQRVHVIAHSWGTMAAALYATRFPQALDRLVLFAPIAARREVEAQPGPAPAWHLISAQDQWDRFSGYPPPGAQPVLPREWFEPWAAAYLETDIDSATRTPRAVKVPGGPGADIDAARTGVLPYDPAQVRAPTLIVRGEWDPWPTDADAQWLFNALQNSPHKRDVKISRGTHVMHLETGRLALFREVETFLRAGDGVDVVRDQ